MGLSHCLVRNSQDRVLLLWTVAEAADKAVRYIDQASAKFTLSIECDFTSHHCLCSYSSQYLMATVQSFFSPLKNLSPNRDYCVLYTRSFSFMLISSDHIITITIVSYKLHTIMLSWLMLVVRWLLCLDREPSSCSVQR